MGKIIQPAHAEIGRIISELLGKTATVTAASEPAVASHVGIFLFRDESLGMVAAGDAAAVAYSGSALTMIPKGVADEAIAEGKPTEMQVDCFQEVMNVVSQAWNLAGGDHIRLVSTKSAAELTDAERSLLAGGSTQLHVTLDVQGYGSGTITFGGV